jgi:anti-sigma regulatory factor (Ser/Thr protein kinase)
MNSGCEHAVEFFEQKIPSRMEEAELLCLKIRAIFATSTLSEFSFPVELLARECLANAVNHGNANDHAKSIVLQVWIGRAWIRLQVTDEGTGFEWRKAMKGTTRTTEVRGRGLRLYAMYGARFRFNRCGNRITIWIDKKKRTGNGD